MRFAAWLLCTLALFGCATKLHWSKPGATPQDFASDSYDCAQQAQRRASPVFWGGRAGGLAPLLADQDDMSKDLYRACLQARGYVRGEGGTFVGLKD